MGWGMVASCYVAATFMGGVGWGMVASCYVAATFMGGWGGVGHGSVMFMLRWCYVGSKLRGKSEKKVTPLLRASS